MAPKSNTRQPMSPDIEQIWSFVQFKFLVLATLDFIVFIDEELVVDWKTTNEYDKTKVANSSSISRILTRAAAIEGAEWDYSDEQRTLHFKRQIAEGIARAFEGNFDQADEALKGADEFRISELTKRKQAIGEQVKVKDRWFSCHQKWTVAHYFIGCSALFFSSLAASKAESLGLSPNLAALCSWLAVCLQLC